MNNLHNEPQALINLGNYIYNLNQITRYVGQNVSLILVVKADAYSHGAIRMAKVANESGIFNFAVASLEEAIELRDNNIKGQILIFGQINPKDAEYVVNHDLTITISNVNNMPKLTNSNILKAHIMIDTGMSRHGLYLHQDSDIDDVMSKIKIIKSNNNLDITGIYTHFATSDNNEDFFNKQLSIFNKLINVLKKYDISCGIVHAANSAATLKYKDSHFDMVRVGLLSYGIANYSQNVFIPKPVMQLKASVIQVKIIQKGDYIGYNNTFQAKKEMKIAIVNIGYADGLPRIISNKSQVLINGHKVKIIGLISMDVMIIDVTKIEVNLFDEVIIFGESNNENLSISDISKAAKTIEYEIFCSIGNRVKRVYI